MLVGVPRFTVFRMVLVPDSKYHLRHLWDTVGLGEPHMGQFTGVPASTVQLGYLGNHFILPEHALLWLAGFNLRRLYILR